ncbi:MAG: sulfatase-like hydrolase/transferase [Chloroflexota bacterium]|nr:sulfatase-like hydrolase/transferase [Chloroflexota bacterium]
MNVIVVMLDSLRRDHIGTYGNDWIRTPNIDRVAARGAVFDNAYVGSYPCLPARRDLWTGRYEFPFRGWGGLERNDVEFPGIISGMKLLPGCQMPDPVAPRPSLISMLILDNWLLISPDGNYHRSFSGWDFIRGQEGDRWITDPTIPIQFPCDPRKLRWAYPEVAQHIRNTAHRRTESDYFAPQVMQSAIDWLERNREANAFLLWIDSFDPHEPWDPPAHYASLYDPGYVGESVISPRYGPSSYLSDEELRHAQALYAGEITMVDRWIGLLLDKIDQLGLAERSLILLMSDHGHLFGEHATVGKPWAAIGDSNMYAELAHIPLIAAGPGIVPGRRIRDLVQPVDVMPTVLEALGIDSAGLDLHGKSLLPLLRSGDGMGRDAVFFGRHREALNVSDGTWTLFQWPLGDARTALYHVSEDPGQLHNVLAQEPDVAERLRAAARDWLSKIDAPPGVREFSWKVADHFP